MEDILIIGMATIISGSVFIAIAAIILGGLYWSEFGPLSIEVENRPVYDLKVINTPPLDGWKLRAFLWAIETWPLRPIITGFIRKDSELYLPRAMAANKVRDANVADLPATFYPHSQPTQQATQLAQQSHDPDLVMKFPSPLYVKQEEEEKKVKVDHFRYYTIEDYARVYREGKVSVVQVAKSVLSVIRDSDSQKWPHPLRAFIAVHDDDVLKQAQESQTRFNNGNPLSIFDGVPIAVKDEFDVRGYVTTGGTKFIKGPPAANDCTIVARLRALGAIIIGKTNMQECGTGTTGMNPHFGFARNPYNLSHVTGGSSSGSAAAVAAGIVPVAIGSDGGGSIRIPSGYCGLFGLKSTYGRVSEHGAFPLAWTVVHSGPLAGTARDAALTYAVVTGSDINDVNTISQPTPHLHSFLKTNDFSDLTIGVFTQYNQDSKPDVSQSVSSFIETLKRRGAKVKEITIPHLQALSRAHLITISSEFAVTLSRYMDKHRKDFSAETRLVLSTGEVFTSQDYLAAQMLRTWSTQLLDNIFKDVDVIITPNTASTAPRIPESAYPDGYFNTEWIGYAMRYIFLPNLTGHPAIAFPVAFDTNNLPISVQVIGRFHEEHTLLRVGNYGDELISKDVNRKRPQLHYSILDLAMHEKQ